MRTVRRPRRYIDASWMTLLRPVMRYSRSRDAFILRGVGASRGPVLRVDRRHGQAFDGVERRHSSAV